MRKSFESFNDDSEIKTCCFE